MISFIKFYTSKLIYRPNLEERNIVITGTSSGIGFELAKICVELGANVYMGNKDPMHFEFPRIKNNQIVKNYSLDLADFHSIDRFCLQLPDNIHYLINNAGVVFNEKNLIHGIESRFFINHIGPFYLTTSLKEKLPDYARVVQVGSNSSVFSDNIQKEDFTSLQNYLLFKLTEKVNLPLFFSQN